MELPRNNIMQNAEKLTQQQNAGCCTKQAANIRNLPRYASYEGSRERRRTLPAGRTSSCGTTRASRGLSQLRSDFVKRFSISLFFTPITSPDPSDEEHDRGTSFFVAVLVVQRISQVAWGASLGFPDSYTPWGKHAGGKGEVKAAVAFCQACFGWR